MSRQKKTEQDSPWKKALDLFLPQFMAFFFPAIHEAIDWARGYLSLEKELQKITPDALVGLRVADKLFKVWRKDGKAAWLLIHIEIQGRREKLFEERMFTYWSRIFQLYRRPVVSLAVLCDENPAWKPQKFSYSMWGCELGFRFLTAKVLEYRGQEERLETESNPFAAVVLAQLKILETRQMPEERGKWKLRLIKGLYERGLKAEEVRQLFKLIDWMMKLPDELDQKFRQELYQFEEERSMPYVSSIERLAKKEGRKEGRQMGLREGLLEGLALAVEAKFGEVDTHLLDEIGPLQSVGQIRKVGRALKKAETIDEFRKSVAKG
jgi:hypothetical protein